MRIDEVFDQLQDNISFRDTIQSPDIISVSISKCEKCIQVINRIIEKYFAQMAYSSESVCATIVLLLVAASRLVFGAALNGDVMAGSTMTYPAFSFPPPTNSTATTPDGSPDNVQVGLHV